MGIRNHDNEYGFRAAPSAHPGNDEDRDILTLQTARRSGEMSWE